MREERTVSPGKHRPRRDFAPDLEGLEQLNLLNAAAPGVAVPAPQQAPLLNAAAPGVAVPAPQHASSHAPISVAQEHGTGGTAVRVARGGAGFISGGGSYAPGAASSTLNQVPGTRLDAAVGFASAFTSAPGLTTALASLSLASAEASLARAEGSALRNAVG
jgi:hypothetical protein